MQVKFQVLLLQSSLLFDHNRTELLVLLRVFAVHWGPKNIYFNLGHLHHLHVCKEYGPSGKYTVFGVNHDSLRKQTVHENWKYTVFLWSYLKSAVDTKTSENIHPELKS